MTQKLLIINPGSTSTKVALFENQTQVIKKSIAHDPTTLKQFKRMIDQYDFRKQAILDFIREAGYDVKQLTAVVGRGGLLKPLASGTYRVNETMISDLRNAIRGEHASNLGALIADAIAKPLSIPAFIVDPVVVDEMHDLARYTGMKEIERVSTFHALNQKAVAKRAAKDLGKPYESLNLIIAHLGGGISVGSHERGKVIDVNNALDGDGPMSPERSGSVPLGPLYKMCFSGQYTLDDIKRKNYGEGGMVAYLGTNDGMEIMKRIQSGDPLATKIHEVMCYQISKEIGAASTVLKGQVDAIILTGGFAYNKLTTDLITSRVSFIAPVHIYPGEDEMLALAEGALRVLNQQEEVKVYA
ncbi:MAG: butyrate kinase [Acholeplasma sp.]|jgi:butyrate kinase|nr:butyrate kinase [Acholeplasma sp.]